MQFDNDPLQQYTRMEIIARFATKVVEILADEWRKETIRGELRSRGILHHAIEHLARLCQLAQVL